MLVAGVAAEAGSNELIAISKGVPHVQRIGKQLLVPFHEFDPLQRSRKLGERSRTPPRFPFVFKAASQTYYFGGAICFDVFDASLFSRWLQLGHGLVEFFVLSSSEEMDATLMFSRIALWNTQFRAVETRRSIARCARGGYSGVIAASGVFHECDLGETSGRTFEIRRPPLETSTSFYTRQGDVLPISAVGCLVVLLGRRYFRG